MATVTLSPEELHRRFVLGVQYLTLTRYLNLSATVALLWDFADTFSRERRYFWGGRWTWLRFLFFVNRYLSIIVQLFNTSTLFSSAVSARVCKFALVDFLPWTGVAEIFVVQTILCFRLHAMYGQKRRVMLSLVALLCSTCLGTVVALAVQISRNDLGAKVTNIPPSATGIIVCFVPVKVSDFAFVAIPVVTFDVVAFLLATYKAYQHLTTKIKVSISVRDNVHVSALVQPVWNGPHLLAVLVRDSLIYFVMICTVYLVNALIWKFQPTASSIVATGWSLTLLSVAGNRMLLRLRETREGDSTHPPTQQSLPDHHELLDLPLSMMGRPDAIVHPAEGSETQLLDKSLTHAMYNL